MIEHYDFPFAELAVKERTAILMDVMQKLTVEQLRTLELHYVDGLSFSAIGRRFSISRAAVHMRHQAAILRVRRMLLARGLFDELREVE